jgi:acetyl esterase/lipase
VLVYFHGGARWALAWVASHTMEYGFDPSCIVAYGASAGGHLASMAGMLPTWSVLGLRACRDVRRVAAWLRAGLPPIFLAHGDADPVVPHAQTAPQMRAAHESLKNHHIVE